MARNVRAHPVAHLVRETRAGLRTAELCQVVELGGAVRAGLISLTTSPDAYKP